MTGGAIFILFAVFLILAALLFLRGERKPPVETDDHSLGFRDPARPTWWRPRE